MADDLFDTLGSDSLFEDEEEELEQDTGEQQNKTFLIAVIVMGGLLALALITFAVWALVINPRMQAQQQAALGVATEAPTLEVEPPIDEEPPVVEEVQTEEPTATPEPTETPQPTATPTPVIGPTATPSTDDAAAGEGEGEGEEATPTPSVVRRTPTPLPTEDATATPTGSGTSGTSGATPARTPDTGLGEVALVIAALLLMAVFFAARRLRQA
ncbi:MAG: hypothetical protein ACP5J4_17425 [Anaerolineae bacterium]